MKSQEIRDRFFNFFISRNHTLVPSSSLIPAQDPTLLFTNAGMNQFKDVFLGKESRPYTKAVSIQKCIRAGGKHNDLDNVGYTKRHLTFFEMMGNFSFGDYFKNDAIRFAWDFLTQEMKLPQDKLYGTVFYADDESYDIWRNEIGLPENRVVRLGAADNFWQMGDTGPCGPCTEIYIDRGTEFGCKKSECAPGCSCDRFLEIWNLVFMEFNRQPDGEDLSLSKKGVDTGMGLERITAIMQDKESVYETDLFAEIIKKIEQETGISYQSARPETKAAFRVLCDHIRSSSFAIADGATPSNDGRGYVLRKIIRRAALFAQKLSDKNFFPELVEPLAHTMGGIYPELITNKEMIQKLLKSEIERFTNNLIAGKAIFEKYINEPETLKSKIISGPQAFKLYDTYGFPVELTRVMAHERGLKVDEAGFETEMEKQRAQSGKKVEYIASSALDDSIETEFVGYQTTNAPGKIIALLVDTNKVDEVPAGEKCWVITDKTPFFVECGGQVSDTATITIGSAMTPVTELKKINNAIAAQIIAPVMLTPGMDVSQAVDTQARLDTMNNHTATHLLQAALIELLGKQVKQSGSLVNPDYLRFDFTYHENLTPEQIKWVEDRVNAKIRENIPLDIFTTTYKDAISKGVIAIFGEKYNPENVRVIDIPGFSKELCGGTHVRATGDIGAFKITEVSALSAGNRRIVALTGRKAIEVFQDTFTITKTLGQELKVKQPDILDAVYKQRDQLKEAQSKLRELKKKLWSAQKSEWLKTTYQLAGMPFVYLPMKDAEGSELREIAQELTATQPGLYFLTAVAPEKTQFYITVSSQYANKIDLTKAMAWLKEQGFTGGGKKDAIQGNVQYIDQKLIDTFKQWIEKQSV